MKRRLITLPLILILLLTNGVAYTKELQKSDDLSFPPTSQKSQNIGEPENLIVTFEELGQAKDETLKGILVTKDYGLRWPDAWEIMPGNSLSFDFSHSLILDEHSSMALDFNGTRLASTLLTPDNSENSNLFVNIPGELIQPGYNTLRVILYMGIHDDHCEDIDNPSVWLTIHKSSFFELSYAVLKPILDLGLYPQPIIDNSNLIENKITFILPEEPNLSEIQGVASISAKLGQLAGFRPLVIQTIVSPTSSEINGLNGDLIILGMISRIVDYGIIRVPLGVDISQPGYGILWMQEAPGDPSSVMIVVTAFDDTGFEIAGRALASGAAYPRFSGESATVKSVPIPQPDEGIIGDVFSFEDLGYPDRTAKGTREQKLNYIIRFSMAWQVMTEGLLDLHIAHSELLDPRDSSLTILVNDTPVGSTLLTSENAIDGMLTLRLPAQLFEIGDNELTLSSDIHLPDYYEDAGDCLDDYFNEAWMVVFSDSTLTLPGGPRGRELNLADYPLAFIGANNLTDLAFIVPPSPDKVIAQAVALISSRVGYFTDSETLYPMVADWQTGQLMADSIPNQILVGRATNNPAIFQLNNNLPQPFIEGSDEPKDLEAVAGLVPYSGSIGFIQALLANSGQPRLVVTGNDDIGVQWAAEALNDKDLNKDLDGDLVILDGPGKIFSAQIKSPSVQRIERGGQADENPIENATPSWVLWLALGSFIIAILALLVFFFIEVIRRQRARRQYESYLQ